MNAQKPPPADAPPAPPATRVATPRPLTPRSPFIAPPRPRVAPRAGLHSALLGTRGPAARAPGTDAAVLTEQSAKGHAPDSRFADAYEPRAHPRAHDDPLDPLLRQPALLALTLAPAPIDPASSQTSVASRASGSLEELMPQLVRKIAWSGDAKRGTVRMELGAGALAGATLLLESDDGRVRVHLNAPAGVDGEAWKRRIGERLAERRIAVDSIEVE